MKNISNYITNKKLYKNIIILKNGFVGITQNIKIATKQNLYSKKNLIDHTAIDFISHLKQVYVFTGDGQKLYLINIPQQAIAISIQKLIKLAYVTEREIYEFFGIFFKEAFDLRRLLTDYSLIGNPLKKAFPLTGFIEIRYSGYKALQYKEINLAQDIRDFSKTNPWRT